MMAVRACRRAIVATVLTAATTVLATPSYACGAAIAPGNTQATMNHEVALVHWAGTAETILMQLAMDATTNDVALVVRTPTPATVAAGDKASFTELNTLSAPQVQKRRHWTLGLSAIVMTVVIRVARRQRRQANTAR